MWFRDIINRKLACIFYCVCLSVSLNGKEGNTGYDYVCVNKDTSIVGYYIWPDLNQSQMISTIGGEQLAGNVDCSIVSGPRAVNETEIRLKRVEQIFGLSPNDESSKSRKEVEFCLSNPKNERCRKVSEPSSQAQKVSKNIDSIRNRPDSMEEKISKIFKEYERQADIKKDDNSPSKEAQSQIKYYQTLVAGILKHYQTELPNAQTADANYAEEQRRIAEENARQEQIARLRQQKEQQERQLAEMRRTGMRTPSKCQEAKEGLAKFENAARMGSQFVGAFGGDTRMLDMAANSAAFWRNAVTVGCVFAGEGDFMEMMGSIASLNSQINSLNQSSRNTTTSSNSYNQSPAPSCSYSGCYRQTLGGQNLCRCEYKCRLSNGQSTSQLQNVAMNYCGG